jgi:hypothetical protein
MQTGGVEIDREAIVADGSAAKVFETIEHPLNGIPAFMRCGAKQFFQTRVTAGGTPVRLDRRRVDEQFGGRTASRGQSMEEARPKPLAAHR